MWTLDSGLSASKASPIFAKLGVGGSPGGSHGDFFDSALRVFRKGKHSFQPSGQSAG